MIADCVAAILAGGKGKRMGGRVKAHCVVDGRTILSRQLEVVLPLFSEVVIISDDTRPFVQTGLRVLPDGKANAGPLAALASALLFARPRWVFALASDMPFVQRDAICLLARYRLGADIVVPHTGGRVHGLHAFYSPRCYAQVYSRLCSGWYRVGDFLSSDSLSVSRVTEGEFGRARVDCLFAHNVNYPEDIP